MSEADLSMLFHAHGDSLLTVLFGYFSIASAFLIAAYLAAPLIPPRLAQLIVTLYSFTAIVLMGMINRQGALIVSVRDQLALAGATWHDAVSEPQFILPTVMNALVIIMLAFYIASIVYFFHARSNVDDKPDTKY